MDKSLVLKIAGVVAIVCGCIALYLSGTGEAQVAAIVGAVFALAGVIAVLFGKK